MHLDISPARQERSRHRHELRTLTYVTLDQANGGIIRNLSHEGIAVQVVAAVRPKQQFRVRFELRYPRLRVETRGEVIWATFSGQCGIRFLDLSPRMARQIDEWIFGNLLEGVPFFQDRDRSVFAESLVTMPLPAAVEDDGLIVSGAAAEVIELLPRPEPQESAPAVRQPVALPQPPVELDWLSQPLSSRGLAWTVNALAVLASLLLFVLVFLAVTRELPKWPAAMAVGAAIGVTVLYWGFFKFFGGASPGARLARMAGYDLEEGKEDDERFR
jgi:PilZ domain-containing protein